MTLKYLGPTKILASEDGTRVIFQSAWGGVAILADAVAELRLEAFDINQWAVRAYTRHGTKQSIAILEGEDAARVEMARIVQVMLEKGGEQ